MQELLCLCGNTIPTGRKKYCSRKCMRKFSHSKWKADNKDKVKAQWAAYYKKHKEKIKAKARSPKAREKDRIRMRLKREADKEGVNRKQRRWYKKNKERAKANIYENRRKRLASQTTLEFSLLSMMLVKPNLRFT